MRAEGAPDRRRADLAPPRELHRERRRRDRARCDRADGRGARGACSSSSAWCWSARWSFSASSNCPDLDLASSSPRQGPRRSAANRSWHGRRRRPRRLRRPKTVLRPLLVVLVALVLVGSGVGAYFGARQTGVFALDRIEVDGAPPRDRRPGSERRCVRTSGESLVRFDRRGRRAAPRRGARRSPMRSSTATSRTPSRCACAWSGRSPSCAAGATPGSSPRRARVLAARSSAAVPAPAADLAAGVGTTSR